ncbi:MAG: HmuY family protein [Gemmatimonadota bacterium]
MTVTALVAVTVLLVSSTLRREEPPSYAPTPARPAEVGDALVRPTVYTVDAREADAWRYFDFSRNSVVDEPGPQEWDLAFQRNRVIANGGDGFAGRGGIADLGTVPFDSVRAVPAEGYVATARDSVNAASEDWYDYSFTSHLLTPRPRTYAVRTADGRYAKLEILAYYCPGAAAGCMTFRYAYQGSGSTSFEP